MTFSSATETQIRAGIAVLGELLRERWPRARAAKHPRNLEAVPIL